MSCEHESDCLSLQGLATGTCTWTHDDHCMYSRLLIGDQHYWTIILVVYDIFTVVVALRHSYLGTNPMCMPVCFQRNLMTLAKVRPAQMIFITTRIIENKNNQ